METKESGSKREVFSEEFITVYNEANYQQRVLRAATTNTSMEEVEEDIQLNQIGTTIEEDVDTLDEMEQKTTMEDGDVGPQQLSPQFSKCNITRSFSTNTFQSTVRPNTGPTITTTEHRLQFLY